MKNFARTLVRNNEGRYLIVKNLGRSRYELPGGKMDDNEDSLRCAIRELFEEVGIVVTGAMVLVDRRSMTAPETGEQWIGDFWLVENYRGDPEIKEPAKLADMRWVTAEEFAGLPQIPLVGVDLVRLADAEKTRQISRRPSAGASQ